jgi:CRP-like cAMP-binding protein
VIISKGLVLSTNLSLGGRSYEDMLIGPGQSQTSFGWLSMIPTGNAPTMAATIVAQTDGEALIIPKQAFVNALGKAGSIGIHKETLQHIAETRLARIQLQQITVFQDSALDEIQINALLDLMHHCEYSDGETIFKASEKVEAAMYFCREGFVTLELNKGESHQTIEAGEYFGENNMLLDQNKEGHKHYSMLSSVTATAQSNNTRLDVLYLEECRKIVDTTHLGLRKPATISARDASLRWTDITRHTLLGSGSFGQVWLASTPAAAGEEDEKRRIVALKIQSKHELVQTEQAQHIVAERHMLASLHSPFILRLLAPFKMMTDFT